jgi:hypothetical protein
MPNLQNLSIVGFRSSHSTHRHTACPYVFTDCVQYVILALTPKPIGAKFLMWRLGLSEQIAVISGSSHRQRLKGAVRKTQDTHHGRVLRSWLPKGSPNKSACYLLL